MGAGVDYTCTVCSATFSSRHLGSLHCTVDHDSKPSASAVLNRGLLPSKTVRIFQSVIHTLSKEACKVITDIERDRVVLSRALEVLSRSDRGATNTKEIVRLLSWSHEARQELLDLSSKLDAKTSDIQDALYYDGAIMVQVLRDIISSEAGRYAVLDLKDTETESENMLNLIEQVRQGEEVYWPIMCGLSLSDTHPEAENPTGLEFLRNLNRVSVRLTELSAKLPETVRISGVVLTSADQCEGGSFADIYHGVYGDSQVAVKKLRGTLYQSRGAFARTARAIGREASIWKDLHHPHVLPFLGATSDIREFPGSLCLVALWAQHGSLSKYMKDNYVTDNDINTWLYQTIRGLSYLHRQNIVHGDLRGANILLDSNRRVRLADFGLSNFADATSATGSPTRHGLPTWTAPEMIDPGVFGMRSARSTRQTDIFDFAAFCWEIHDGHSPFRDRTTMQALLAISKGQRPARTDCRKDISATIWNIIEDCWRQNPQHRPSANEVSLALAPLTTAPSPASDSTAMDTRRRRIHKASTLPAYSVAPTAKSRTEPKRGESLGALNTRVETGSSSTYAPQSCTCVTASSRSRCPVHHRNSQKEIVPPMHGPFSVM